MSVAASYFTNLSRPYWQWQDDGNVVAWTDGATIVFRGELLTVFRRMQTISLPPFGSVVLLLAACREAWKDETDKLGLLAGMLKTGRRVDRLELLNRVFEGLDRVRALPAALRTSPEAKAELAAMVFEKQLDPPSPGAYDLLLVALEHGLGDLTAVTLQKVDIVDRLLRDLAWLDQGLARVNAAMLAARLKTGFEQPIVPVEVEVPLLGSARTLISELQDDPELGGVARLAKLLAATVNLPRPLSVPEELPLGGVSDISNRGTLDRLLLSELANDDETLSVRVAMNEALYLRREVPPRPPARRRLILLDSGLRMWGVPRLFAASVGLALAAGADAPTDVIVLRAAGSQPSDVDFTTAAGLTDHLAALDARVQPGESFAALRAIVDEAAEATDVVLVTTGDVLADRTFQRALAEAAFDNVHLAVVERSGDFELLLQTGRGRKLLKQASFALDEIFAPTKKPAVPKKSTVPLLDDSRDALPAIFGVKPFPLRLSCPVDTERSWTVKDRGALTYTRDGRLLHWTDPKLGARQIAEGLVDGELHWAATRLEAGLNLAAVIGRRSRKGLRALYVDLDADAPSCETLLLESEIEQPRQVFVHRKTVFIADAKTAIAVDATTGAPFRKVSTVGLTHVHARFYREVRSGFVAWKALMFDGTAIRRIGLYAESVGRAQIVSMFERDDEEGPIAVLRSGELMNLATGKKRTFHDGPAIPPEASTVAVSRDGSRLIFKTNSPIAYTLDVHSLVRTLIRHPQPADLEPRLLQAAKPVAMRHRFLGIGLDTSGRLTLIGRRDGYWPIEQEQTTGTLRLAPERSLLSLRVQHRFEKWESPHVPHSLWLATFADGSRAVLDARGLLHLKSSDHALPEITIVLAEGVGACWTSDGRVAGSRYHLDESLSPRTWDGELRRIFTRFTERLR